MSPVDLSQWPSVEEAAVALHTSARSIIRHNARGELEFRKRARPGKKPENVCNPDDLQKLLPQPYSVRHLEYAGDRFQDEIANLPPPPMAGDRFERFLNAIEAATTQRALPAPEAAAPAIAPPAAVALDRKLWLTIPEASIYSGFSSLKLRAAIKDGRLTARPDGPRGAVIIRRAALEEFAG